MLVIYGPTVTGKTDTALHLAKKYDGEIISADSRQVYTGLDIGSGKISQVDNVQKHAGYWLVEGVKIHGFDVVPAGKDFNVSDFVRFCTKKVLEIKKQNKLPIIVGGTGFYIKAYLEGMDFQNTRPNKELRKTLNKLTREELFKKLFEVDSKRASSMNQSDKNNPRRLIRAIEISTQPKNAKVILINGKLKNYTILGLTAPNNYLYSRADAWLERRLEMGLLEEVQRLVKEGVSTNWLLKLGLEYKWTVKILKNESGKQEALSSLKGEIHALIRRQKTYFNQFKNIEILDIKSRNFRENLESACAQSRG